MAKKRPREIREQINETLTRVTTADSHFKARYEFTGRLEVFCPRCQRTVAIVAATIFMDLSCGCSWHSPDRHRKRNSDAWTSYEQHAISADTSAKTQDKTQE